MSKGKRYSGDEQQLNMKKVFGVIIVLALIVLFVVGIKKIINADKKVMASKNIELAYFPVLSNGNWGVINSSGQTIIEPAYTEMIMIPDKSKPVFVITYESNYVDGSYKTKVVNSKNEELFTEYENIITLQNYDENNNFWYEDSVLKVQKDGKYGLINLDGNIVLNCEYDSITTIKGMKNSLMIKKDGSVGLANSSGKLIIPVEYADVATLTKQYFNGYIVKNAQGKYGVIDSDGSTVLECIYDGIKNITDSGIYIVNEQGQWKAIFKDGTSYLEGKLSGATEINSGNIIVNNGGKYGILNIQTDLQVPIEYENLIYAFGQNYIAKKEGKFGVININNEVVIPFEYTNMQLNKELNYIKAQKSEEIYDFINESLEVKITAGNETIVNNGYLKFVINGETKYYNSKLEEKTNKDVYASNTLFIVKENGKYGFVNKNGTRVVECTYEDATEQNDYGYSGIKMNGKWGAIDQYGNIVISPTYEISDTEIVDFIGKWHACADYNANYYTDVE